MRILPFESSGVDGLHFFVHLVKDLTIRHHLPGGTDLSCICEVIFCLYLFFCFADHVYDLISSCSVFRPLVVTLLLLYNVLYCAGAFCA